MTALPRLPIALLLAISALAACVPQGDVPSLAVRPAERDRTTLPPVRPTLDVPSDPALGQRIAELQRDAAAGDRAFDAAFGPTEAAIVRAGAPASESWVEAQLALSRLEAARNDTARALTELDRLAIDRAAVPTNEADYAAILEAIAAVEAIAALQQRRLDGLRARLSSL